jgi:hypothetical protein
MKKIILSLFLLIFYSNIASAQYHKQIDIERECLNCGACGTTLQMRWGEHQGKLYDTIRLAYFRNQKISINYPPTAKGCAGFKPKRKHVAKYNTHHSIFQADL